MYLPYFGMGINGEVEIVRMGGVIMRLSGFFDRYGVTGNSSVCVSGVKGSIVSGGT